MLTTHDTMLVMQLYLMASCASVRERRWSPPPSEGRRHVCANFDRAWRCQRFPEPADRSLSASFELRSPFRRARKPRVRGPLTTMHLLVRQLSGRTAAVDVDSSDTVADLKRALSQARRPGAEHILARRPPPSPSPATAHLLVACCPCPPAAEARWPASPPPSAGARRPAAGRRPRAGRVRPDAQRHAVPDVTPARRQARQGRPA